MASRWACLAVRAHLRGAIDYSKQPVIGSWEFIEAALFNELERESLNKLDDLIYQEHLATMTALYEEEFNTERRSARSVYNRLGRRLAPWLVWRSDKTVADMLGEARSRRADKAYVDELKQVQRELDDDAKRIAAAVEAELAMRKAAEEHRQAQTSRRTVVRHGQRVSKRSFSGKARGKA